MTRKEQAWDNEARKAENEYLKARRKECLVCEGVGFITTFYLVTYEGKNWATIRKRERIFRGEYRSEYEASVELRKKLANNSPDVNQQVLSAALECVCRHRAATNVGA